MNRDPAGSRDFKAQIRDDVARLLAFGVKHHGVDIKQDFLQMVVPLLGRDPGDLTDAESVRLWEAYNKLSAELSPVTAESIEIAEELSEKRRHNVDHDLNWMLLGVALIVLVVFFVQTYSTTLNNRLDYYGKLLAQYGQTLEKEQAALQATGGKTATLEPLIAEKASLQKQILLTIQSQCALPFMTGSCERYNSWITEVCGNNAPAKCPETLDLSMIREVANYGSSFYTILNSLVSPFLLGFLGAAAYLTRNTLNGLAESTYRASWRGRLPMRLLLGGLLGVIGPLIYSSGNMENVGLGLSLFAFLLGYSVELAFTLFDRFIDYVRNAVKPESKPVSTISTRTDVGTAPSPEEFSTRPATEGPGDFSRLLRNLREILLIESALESSLPAEYFATEIKPRIELARKYLGALDTALASPEFDSAAANRLWTGMGREASDLTGPNHPIAVILATALESFSAVASNDNRVTTDAEAIASALFAGSVTAFREGPSVYEHWMAYILDQPYTIRPDLLTTAQARICLDSTGIFKRAFGAATEASLGKLLTLALSEKSPEQLADELWASPEDLEGESIKIKESFSGIDEVAEGWSEFRRALLRYVLQYMDFPSGRLRIDKLPELQVSELLPVIDALRENKNSARDLDILGHLARELMATAHSATEISVVDSIRRLWPFVTARRTRGQPDACPPFEAKAHAPPFPENANAFVQVSPTPAGAELN